MSQIILNLTDQAVSDFAAFYGYEATVDDAPNPVTVEQYVTDRLLEKITNDLVEKRNRDAILALQNQPAPSITQE
jgi:hypothetical protein